MSTKINKHVFHGVYSNFGYRPSFSADRRLANYPIHFFRASFGEKDGGSVKEFQTEEEVLKWYKKNKYGESQFNELEFPKDFCKNYFIIPESEFSKYHGLFNRMIKGLKITSDIEIQSEGTAFSPECPECKRDFRDGSAESGDTAGPIVFNSPDGSPTYFEATGVADDVGFLNGQRITVGDSAAAFDQDLLPKTPQSVLSFTAEDRQGMNVRIEATVTWYKKIQYKQKVKININFDSTKIFDFPEVQKRLGAHDMDYETTIDIEEDKNKEELISELNKKIYKEEWQFDQNEFKSIFQNEKNKFNYNATFINDPVIIPSLSTYTNSQTTVSIINKHKFNGDSGTLTSEVVNKQKNFEKTFEKFGSIQYKIENDNSIVTNGEQFINFYISKLFYIKSKKIYLCFIEMHHAIPLDGSVIDKEKDCGDLECEETSSSSSSEPATSSNSSYVLGSDSNRMLSIMSILDDEDLVKMLNSENYSKIADTNPFNIEYVFTTRDSINIDPPKYKTSECDEEEKELEFEKTKCDLKISNKTFEIEIFKLKETQFVFDNQNCEDLTPGFKKLIKNTLKINTVKKPLFEILEWKSTDINKNNTFPPKIS